MSSYKTEKAVIIIVYCLYGMNGLFKWLQFVCVCVCVCVCVFLFVFVFVFVFVFFEGGGECSFDRNVGYEKLGVHLR